MTTETFMQAYQMGCPRAVERLLRMGVPEPMKGGADEANHAVTVAETVQHFISTTDAVKLDQRAVDELQTTVGTWSCGRATCAPAVTTSARFERVDNDISSLPRQ